METGELILRPLTVDDLDNVMTWVNDHEILTYFANRQTDVTRDEEQKFIEQLIASKTDRVYSIFFKEEDAETYLGQCSLNQIYWPAGNGRLFVVIRKQAQGWGYGTRAIEALLKKAWSELNLHKVFLIVRKDNRHAQAMYLKLGFEFEGILRDEYCVNGKYYDMVRMGIIRPATV